MKCAAKDGSRVAELGRVRLAEFSRIRLVCRLRFALHFAAVGDDDSLGWRAALRAGLLHFLDHVYAARDLAEHDVLAVEMRGGRGADEELRTIGGAAGVGHRHSARDEVLARFALTRFV